jgi:hypothetical protein
MDNGLIFPYPQKSAQDEPICTNYLINSMASAGDAGD